MKKTNRALTLIASLLLSIALFAALPASAEIASGTWGTCSWTIDDVGLLTINGGQLPDSGNATINSPPWKAYAKDIMSVVVGDGVSTGKSAASLFRGLTNATSIDVSLLDTSQATTIEHMFEGNTNLKHVNVTNLVHEDVTSIYGAFQNITPAAPTGLVIEGLETWVVDNVTNMHEPFRTSKFQSLKGIEAWNTSNVTNMDSFLWGSVIVKEELLDLSGWDVSNVTDFNFSFGGIRVYDYSIAGWSPQQLPNRLQRAFGGNMTRLDLSKWNNLYIPPPDDPAFFAYLYGDVFWVKPTVLMLNPNFKFYKGDGFAFSPPANNEYTGLWQAVGTGTEATPKGKTYTTAELRALYNGVASFGPAETYVWQRKTITIAVTKAWANDIGIPDPNSVTMELLRNNEPAETAELSAAKNWTHAFANLPATDAQGVAFTYTVEEAAVPGYDSETTTDPETGAVTITNTRRQPKPIEVVFAARKTLEGAALTDGQFSFLLTAPDGAKITARNDAAGMVKFPARQIALPGTYTYKIEEQLGTADGTTYDSAKYELTVTAKLDEATGDLSEDLTWQITRDGLAHQGELTFINRWTPADEPTAVPEPTAAPAAKPTDPPPAAYPTLEVPLTAKKVLKNGTLKAGDYTFVLKDAKGNVLAEVGNLQDGAVFFPNRTFSRAVSNYTYTISEKAGTDRKVTYDATVYTVKITTAPRNGLLEAKVDILKNGTPYAGEMVFTNIRKVPPTGDSTPTTILLMAMAVAALLSGAAFVSRRYNKTA